MRVESSCSSERGNGKSEYQTVFKQLTPDNRDSRWCVTTAQKSSAEPWRHHIEHVEMVGGAASVKKFEAVCSNESRRAVATPVAEDKLCVHSVETFCTSSATGSRHNDLNGRIWDGEGSVCGVRWFSLAVGGRGPCSHRQEAQANTNSHQSVHAMQLLISNHPSPQIQKPQKT